MVVKKFETSKKSSADAEKKCILKLCCRLMPKNAFVRQSRRVNHIDSERARNNCRFSSFVLEEKGNTKIFLLKLYSTLIISYIWLIQVNINTCVRNIYVTPILVLMLIMVKNIPK